MTRYLAKTNIGSTFRTSKPFQSYLDAHASFYLRSQHPSASRIATSPSDGPPRIHPQSLKPQNPLKTFTVSALYWFLKAIFCFSKDGFEHLVCEELFYCTKQKANLTSRPVRKRFPLSAHTALKEGGCSISQKAEVSNPLLTNVDIIAPSGSLSCTEVQQKLRGCLFLLKHVQTGSKIYMEYGSVHHVQISGEKRTGESEPIAIDASA